MKENHKDLPHPLNPENRYLGLSSPIIALTGGISSGKSLALKELSRLGFMTLSADEVVKELYKDPIVIKRINTEVLGTDSKSVDLKKLRSLMAEDSLVKEKLESIIHPLVHDKVQKKISNISKQPIIYEIPLLFEKGLQDKFDIVVVISLEEASQVERLTRRDVISEIDARKMISIQLPNDLKENQADILIKNNTDIDDFKHLVSLAGKRLKDWFHQHFPKD
jgi:dephospho-CoA kinase